METAVKIYSGTIGDCINSIFFSIDPEEKFGYKIEFKTIRIIEEDAYANSSIQLVAKNYVDFFLGLIKEHILEDFDKPNQEIDNNELTLTYKFRTMKIPTPTLMWMIRQLKTFQTEDLNDESFLEIHQYVYTD